MFDITKFGIYLSRLRKNADMTQSELAERLNVTHQAISRYEKGHCFPDVSILIQLADMFGITIDELINGGEPTPAESVILENVVRGKGDFAVNDFSAIAGLAPILKPSVLEKLSENCLKQGIDISSLVELAEYLNDETVLSFMEGANFRSVSDRIFQKLVPLLDIKSKSVLFEKIIEGEIDWHFLEILLPYAEFLTSQIEAAVIEGALPEEALNILFRHYWDEKGYRYKNG